MTGAVDEALVQRIAEAGHRQLLVRLRAAFEEVASERGAELPAERLDEALQEAAGRAPAPLWRLALAEAAAPELGLEVGEAVGHPAVEAAAGLAGAPAWERPPEAEPEPLPPLAELHAIRVPAVHLRGIQTLREGAEDIELRFSDAGLDVIGTGDGEPIGRLGWEEIEVLELARPRRALRRRRSGMELLVGTERGEARFALPELSEEEAREQLSPMLERGRGSQARRA